MRILSLTAFAFFLLSAQPGWSYDVVVAKDGSGQYTRVQDAIDAVPGIKIERVVIFIKKGVYREKLKLDFMQRLVTLIGEDKDSTIITYDDYSGKTDSEGRKMHTFNSATFFVYANDFRAENLTFANSAGPVGQAVAVHVAGDRAVFVNCRFLGFQDTLFTANEQSRQYYRNCYIEGTTDFIFGASTVVFENCVIHSKKGGQYVTAASTSAGKSFGYVFVRCQLTGDAPKADVYLGRPWRIFAKTVFLECQMGEHIKPEGWHNWQKPEAEKTSYYAEYQSSGPGAAPQSRVTWARQLSEKEAKTYQVKKILAGTDHWNPLQ